MIKLVLACAISLLAGCSEQRRASKFKLERPLSEPAQAEIVHNLRAMAEQNQLVAVEGGFDREGRRVWQLDLKSDGCLIMTSDNFAARNMVSIYFYKCERTDWHHVRSLVLPIVGGP